MLEDTIVDKRLMQKLCSKCGETKPTSEFNFNCCWCKNCVQLYNKTYRAEHLDRIRENDRQYAVLHRKQAIERAKKHYFANLEQKREYARNYQAEHSKQKCEYDRNYRAARPGISTERWRRRRALEMNAEGNGVTIQEWEEIKKDYNYLCAYCNQKKTLEMDHIVPLSKGGKHDVDNVVPACKSCNSSKTASSLLIFLYQRLPKRKTKQEYGLTRE